MTVSVLADSGEPSADFHESDCSFDTYIGRGPGGQHRQKNATAVRVTHLPTGTVVTCESERSMRQNKREALRVLRSRLQEGARVAAENAENATRRDQIGTGYRGDKVRTVQMQNNRVTNHTNGRKCSAKEYLKGRLEMIQ